MIDLYQRPIGNEMYEFKNKIKTYGYTYRDTSYYPEYPFYKRQEIENKEYYGNITVEFDNNCNVVKFISIDEEFYKKITNDQFLKIVNGDDQI